MKANANRSNNGYNNSSGKIMINSTSSRMIEGSSSFNSKNFNYAIFESSKDIKDREEEIEYEEIQECAT